MCHVFLGSRHIENSRLMKNGVGLVIIRGVPDYVADFRKFLIFPYGLDLIQMLEILGSLSCRHTWSLALSK